MGDARTAFDITPSDTDPIPGGADKLLCTVGGNVVLVLAADQDAAAITLTLAAGDILTGLKIKKVMATGTTATVKGLR